MRFLNPGTRRRRPADPAPQRGTRSPARRCSAGRANDEIARAAARPRLRRPSSSSGDDPAAGPPATSRRAGRRPTTAIQRDPADARAADGDRRAPELAGHRAAHAEGLDRPGRGRRRAGRGHLPRPPGPARRRAGEPRAPGACSRTWMRSYRPEERFDEDGASSPSSQALAPAGDKRMGASPHANGGRLLRAAGPARPRALRGRRSPTRASTRPSRPARWASSLRDLIAAPTATASGSSARTRPTRTGSARCSRSRTAA